MNITQTECKFRGLVSVTALRLTVLLAVFLTDVLFYRHPYGWAYGAFAVLLGALVLARPAPLSRRKAILAAFLGVALTSGAIAYRGGLLAPLMCVAFLFAMVGARAERQPAHADTWATAVLRAPLRVLQAVAHDCQIHRRSSPWRRLLTSVSRALLAWILPVILGGVFLKLFCAANPVIQRTTVSTLVSVRTWLLALSLPSFSRVLLWVCAAVSVWGLLRARRRCARRPPPLPVPVLQAQATETRGSIEMADGAANAKVSVPGLALRSLALFNAIFLCETVTDLLYLWGGRMLPAGMTYADYAHRGAYPLLATALLSAGIVLVMFQPGGVAERHRGARTLVLAWLAQNVLLTVSALWRLHLYVSVYSLTRLRLAACLWMLLVALGIVAIACRIMQRRGNQWLLDLNAGVLLAVLLCCTWWPMDAYIAHHNVRNCSENGANSQALDLAYMKHLGSEAIPALRVYATLDHARSIEAAQAADRLSRDLRTKLRDPMAWTWRRRQCLKHAP